MTNINLPKHRSGALNAAQMDYILLDGSSSMQPKWEDSLRAIESYVQTLKSANVHSHITLTTFCTHDIQFVHRDAPITEWKSMYDEPIGSFWGGTPLYDAIVMMGARLRDLNPSRCSIVIVTDGQDTGGKFTIDTAKSILDWCRAKGWQVTFIGAAFRNADQARALGADESQAVGVSQERLSDAAASLAKKRIRYGVTGDDIGFTDDEKGQFGGYLNGPAS
jgi:hypothetical protein